MLNNIVDSIEQCEQQHCSLLFYQYNPEQVIRFFPCTLVISQGWTNVHLTGGVQIFVRTGGCVRCATKGLTGLFIFCHLLTQHILISYFMDYP